MIRLLYLLPAGVFSHALLPRLPPSAALYALLLLSLLALPGSRRLRGPGCFLLGFALGALWAHQQMEHRLPVELDKTDVTVRGRVSSLAIGDDRRTVFDFQVDEILAPESGSVPVLRKLRLSWYGDVPVGAGERWQLRARLRTPRGFSNPGGFDYGGWLLSRGISATGYVRGSDANRRLAPAPFWSPHHLRERLLGSLLAFPTPSADARGLMAALVLGEQALIPRARFRQLKETGTVHLVVVSGLHIGMVTGLGFLLGLGAGRAASALGFRQPARVVAIPFAFFAAACYSVLAGLDLPVQRALIMNCAALVALATRRTPHIWHAAGLALTAVAAVDPLAALSSGFWLSFMAVFGLLAWFGYRPVTGRWRQLIAAQVVVFVSLAPWLAYFQGAVSLWALPVNLLAITWVGLLIVPFCLLGALFQLVPVIGELCWWLAAIQLQWLLEGLSRIEALTRASPLSPLIHLPASNWRVWMLLALVVLLFQLPRGLPRFPPILVLLATLAGMEPRSPVRLELTVLDVGQGLAAVIRAADAVLVYDAGPGYPSGFNTGEAVVAPYLDTLGIGRIDRLIVSHGDMDHAGGVPGLMATKEVDRLISGEPERTAGNRGVPCRQGKSWRWGEATFRFLWPSTANDGAPRSGDNNNRSCVLLVEMADVRLLLPGDIEAPVERYLLDRYWRSGGDGVTVLVAPHHGSKTSSSPGFVNALTPRHTVFSAGFNHHFGHPHPRVEQRYRDRGSELWWTARSGAVTFRWDEQGDFAIREHRKTDRRYWH